MFPIPPTAPMLSTVPVAPAAATASERVSASRLEKGEREKTGYAPLECRADRHATCGLHGELSARLVGYWGASLTRNRTPLGPYRRHKP